MWRPGFNIDCNVIWVNTGKQGKLSANFVSHCFHCLGLQLVHDRFIEAVFNHGMRSKVLNHMKYKYFGIKLPRDVERLPQRPD